MTRSALYCIVLSACVALAACGDDGATSSDGGTTTPTNTNNSTTSTNNGTTTANNASTSTNNATTSTNNATTSTNNATTSTNNSTTSTNNSTTSTNNSTTSTNNATTSTNNSTTASPCSDDELLAACGGEPEGTDCAVAEDDAIVCLGIVSADTEVLLLGDGSEAQTDEAGVPAVVSALREAGLNVTSGPKYHTWAGQDVDDDVVIVLMGGYEYGNTMTDGGAAALERHLARGGSILRTEWILYDLAYGQERAAIDERLPVEGVDGSYVRPIPWTEADSIDPTIAEGVALPFSEEGAGCTIAQEPKASAVVLASTEACGAMVSYLDHGEGRMMHFNSDLASETLTAPNPNALRLLVNSVRFLLQ